MSAVSFKSAIIRHSLLSLAFVVFALLLSLPGVIFVSRLGWTAWYPATGLLLALLLGISPRYAALVCITDTLSSRLLYHQPITSFGGTVGAVGVSLCYAAAACVLRGPLRIDPCLRRGRDVMRYISVSGIAAFCAAISGALCLIGDHSIRPTEFWPSVGDWFIGDAIGIVGLAPFLLIHVCPAVRRWLSVEAGDRSIQKRNVKSSQKREWFVIESVTQAASLFVVLWIMFGSRWAHLELFYLSFIPTLWLGMRFGVNAAVIGNVGINFGIVVSMHLFPLDPALLAKIGMLMLVVSSSGLIVGATVSEREHLRVVLNERTTYLNSLFENSPLGIVVLNYQGRVDLVNDAFSKLSLFTPAEIIGNKLDEVFVLEEGSQITDWFTAVLNGQAVHQILRRVRKNGSTADIELQAVPLAIEGHVQGAYAICRDISEQIKASVAERQHAESLNRLVKELEVQTDQMSMLNDMSGLLECCGTSQEAYSVVVQSAQNIFPEAISGTLYTFKASRNLVEAAVSWGNHSLLEPTFAPQDCWALRRGRPHRSETGGKGVVCPHFRNLPPSSHLCFPMVGQGETLGILHLELPTVEKQNSDLLLSQERLGITVAGQIALSLASLRLRETLRDQSIRDPLTGLYNRRFMQESLEREIMRCRRKNRPLSLLFLDVDHFKRFNDTFGHDAGDFVLQSLADLLRGFFRGDDVACRCGGEEFAVILPESSAKDSAARADQLRTELKNMKMLYKNRRLGSISVSVGVGAFPDHCATADELVKISDQCLYQSKTDGRDRVTIAKTPRQRASYST